VKPNPQPVTSQIGAEVISTTGIFLDGPTPPQGSSFELIARYLFGSRIAAKTSAGIEANAWLNRCRRLAKDWECLNRKALAFLRLASIHLMLRKLFNPA